MLKRSSDLNNVCCTWTFLPLPNVVFYFLTLIKRFIACTLDLGTMHKQIFSSIVLKDETESFLCIEKLYYACTHTVCSLVRLISVVPQCIKKRLDIGQTWSSKGNYQDFRINSTKPEFCRINCQSLSQPSFRLLYPFVILSVVRLFFTSNHN